MELVTIGKVINVRGLKGELKIESLSNFSPLRYKKGSIIILEDETTNQVFNYKVKGYFQDGRFDYVQFEEIKDVDTARKYVGLYLKIYIQELKNHDKDTFYYHQLIGCEVRTYKNEVVGIVTKVEDIGPHHILRIKANSRKQDILVPFLWQFLDKVDPVEKTIVLKEVEGLLWQKSIF